jgi:hypothetical protein
MMPVPAEARPVLRSGQVCTMLATDIAGYSSPARNEETRLHLRDTLYRVLGESLSGAGIPWEACHREDRGDGVLVVVPPEIPARGLINPFPDRLRHTIRRHNRMSSEAARMRLRATVHVGPVDVDAHGLAGDDLTYLFRMLDARPLRAVLNNQESELALAVSGYVYQTMILRHPSLADPAQFTPFRSRVKRATINGWLYTPGRD